VHLTATVTCPGDPSGAPLGLTFWDGGDILVESAPVTPDGAATFDATGLTVGTHTITAAYNGNTNCSASSAETMVVVSAAPVPPTPPNGLCLLACGGLINFNVGDIHNEVNIYHVSRGPSAHHG
jgi:hypothetical protein